MMMRRIFFLIWLMASVTFAAAAAGPFTVRVACIGDSITYGVGTDDRETESYPSRLQQLLGDGYEVGNFGKSGATLLRNGHRPYTGQPEYTQALSFVPDIAVIHLGVNDTDPRDWPNFRDEFVQDYLFLINSLRSVNEDVRILIAEITPITSDHRRFCSGTGLWQREIRSAIRTVAEVADVQLVDFFTPLFMHPDLIPDAVHPDSMGAMLLARAAYSAITGDFGGLSMPLLYSDGMVLQRDCPISISGIADTGSEVTVKFAGEKRKTMAGTDGKWKVCFRPMPAAVGLTLEISAGGESLVYDNVAIGDVWLCSGQSNMEFPVRDMIGKNDVLASADDRNLRLFDMKAKWRTDNIAWPAEAVEAVQKLDYYVDTEWVPSNRVTAEKFSAVGYCFGHMLRDSLDVPVGLICNAIGGSTTESWIDRQTLQQDFPLILKDWLDNDFVQAWARGRAAKNLDSKNTGKHRHPYEPCYLFEAGIMPLAGYPIKGVIWYQGESNAHNFEVHEKLFGLLVDSWRSYWNNPDLPFYFVQLSSIGRPSWPWFRDSQRRLAEKLTHAGMAVSSDLGDSLDVHPKNKRPVGERLARLALHYEYGYSDLVPSGPAVRAAEILDDGKVMVHFNWNEGLTTSDGAPVRTFEVAEYPGLFYPADAVICGDSVVLSCKDVSHPRYVRYGWQPYTRANLVNSSGLPASTFLVDITDTAAPRCGCVL